jgi:hypothetical protein
MAIDTYPIRPPCPAANRWLTLVAEVGAERGYLVFCTCGAWHPISPPVDIVVDGSVDKVSRV